MLILDVSFHVASVAGHDPEMEERCPEGAAIHAKDGALTLPAPTETPAFWDDGSTADIRASPGGGDP